MLWAKMLQRASPTTPRKGERDARLSLAERRIENTVGHFTESAAGSERTAPVDDTVNGALALRGRVAVRASVLDERSEASGLEISSDEPSKSAGASLVAPSLLLSLMLTQTL